MNSSSNTSARCPKSFSKRRFSENTGASSANKLAKLRAVSMKPPRKRRLRMSTQTEVEKPSDESRETLMALLIRKTVRLEDENLVLRQIPKKLGVTIPKVLE